jgi:hypothetical protein
MSARTVSSICVAAAVATMALAGGCTRRAHMRDDFGVPTRSFYDRQAAATKDGGGDGLDSEEAALIHANYRKTLGNGAGARTADPKSQVLIVEPDGNGYHRAK